MQRTTAHEAAPESLEEAQEKIREYEAALAYFAEVCSGAVRGNLEPRIIRVEGGPVLKNLALSINDLIDIADAFARETHSALHATSQGKTYRLMELGGLGGSFRRAAILSNEAVEQIRAYTADLHKKKAEYIALAEDFEITVQHALGAVASAATEMEAVARGLSDGADLCSKEVTAVAVASQKMAVNVSDVARSADALTLAAHDVAKQAQESQQVTTTAMTAAEHGNTIVTRLNEASTNIGSVVKVVSRIASQTNLLALNATIEAARAGDVGRGFSVVATEVKNLARQTAEATHYIDGEVLAIQKSVKEVSEMIHRIRDAIGLTSSISSKVTEVMRGNAQSAATIGADAKSASEKTTSVSVAIDSVSKSMNDTLYAAKGLLEAAGELSKQAEGLRMESATFIQKARAS